MDDINFTKVSNIIKSVIINKNISSLICEYIQRIKHKAIKIEDYDEGTMRLKPQIKRTQSDYDLFYIFSEHGHVSNLLLEINQVTQCSLCYRENLTGNVERYALINYNDPIVDIKFSLIKAVAWRHMIDIIEKGDLPIEYFDGGINISTGYVKFNSNTLRIYDEDDKLISITFGGNRRLEVRRVIVKVWKLICTTFNSHYIKLELDSIYLSKRDNRTKGIH